HQILSKRLYMMFDKNIEISKNAQFITIKDFEKFEKDYLKQNYTNNDTKYIFKITTLENLEKFHKMELLNFNSRHVSIECSKQIYLMLNTSKLINQSIVKSVDIRNMNIILNLYVVEEISESILENNTKMLKRIEFLTEDLKVHSKNYEILYQANSILKEFNKTDKKYKNVKTRINKLNDLVNK